jgi:hypothetical protein
VPLATVLTHSFYPEEPLGTDEKSSENVNKPFPLGNLIKSRNLGTSKNRNNPKTFLVYRKDFILNL